MVVSRKLPVTGRPERCCTYECDYSVPKVRYHLSRLRMYERAGEEAGRLYSAPLLERYSGAPGDGETAALDITRAVEQLRAAGVSITAEVVAARLCPWSGGDGE